MGMTNKQCQGVIRLMLLLLKEVLEEIPDNVKLQAVVDTLQAMLEDGE